MDSQLRRISAGVLFALCAACTLGAVVFFGRAPGVGVAEDGELPEVHDDRLGLTLFASEPDVMTPIGIVVDDRDRIFVLESHTHMPPSDYEGPEGDRVKVFTDEDGDGHPEKVSVFAEGIEDGMNLAFSPAGELYVVTSRGVWVLHDRDGDGVSESREQVLRMVEPDYVYDHAGLLGITFSRDGWMYVSRGNTGSAGWVIEGTDGGTVQGYGDGGDILRARPGGSELHEVATGFWNPFDLKFDRRGRLLAADNDPDSRGPNRLVHVVPEGDYGYQSLYGGSGIHPYLAWNGELPGTLPYAAGLGEAPSGILEADLAALPPDYEDDVLVTIWEESEISRVRLSPEGASLTGETEVLIAGDEQFRPVAMATDSRGNIYITDWVLRAYPNHGRGRIWRLSAKPGVEVTPPRSYFDPPLPNPSGDLLEALYAADEAADFDRLREALTSGDPFVRTAAVTALGRPVFRGPVIEATQDADADVRLGALLALRRAGLERPEPIARRLLGDPDPHVRRMALVWVGQKTMTALRPDLEQVLAAGPVSPELFETYLATVRHLQPAFVEAYRSRAERSANQIERSLPPQFIEQIVRDPARPAELRAVALTHLEHPEEQFDLLAELARAGGDPLLRLEAVRTLAEAAQPQGAAVLLDIARERSNPAVLRAEALLALGRQPEGAAAEVIPLLDDPEPAVRLEAARYLRTQSLSAGMRERLEERYAALRGDHAREALAEQLAFVLYPAGSEAHADRPRTIEAWQAALARGGDPAVGRRVFFSLQAQCAQCHAVENRGGDFGPDLTNAGRSKDRAQLVRAILRPSEEVAPGWQGWYVETEDGQVHYGRQIDVGGDAVDLLTLTGAFATYRDVQDYGVMEHSLMPSGLETQLTVSDLRSLLAFLEQER